MYYYGMHGWGMAAGWLILIGALVLFLYLINARRKGSPSAKEILDRRYANGEIDTKEYHERLRELGYGREGDETF